MKRKDIEQLANTAASELEAKIKEGRIKLEGLRSEKEMGKLKNVHAITVLRKDIARMITFLKTK